MVMLWILVLVFGSNHCEYSTYGTSCSVIYVNQDGDLAIHCYLRQSTLHPVTGFDIRHNGNMIVFCNLDSNTTYSCTYTKTQKNIHLPVYDFISLPLAKADKGMEGTYVCKRNVVVLKEEPDFKNCTFVLPEIDAINTQVMEHTIRKTTSLPDTIVTQVTDSTAYSTTTSPSDTNVTYILLACLIVLLFLILTVVLLLWKCFRIQLCRNEACMEIKIRRNDKICCQQKNHKNRLSDQKRNKNEDEQQKEPFLNEGTQRVDSEDGNQRRPNVLHDETHLEQHQLESDSIPEQDKPAKERPKDKGEDDMIDAAPAGHSARVTIVNEIATLEEVGLSQSLTSEGAGGMSNEKETGEINTEKLLAACATPKAGATQADTLETGQDQSVTSPKEDKNDKADKHGHPSNQLQLESSKATFLTTVSGSTCVPADDLFKETISRLYGLQASSEESEWELTDICRELASRLCVQQCAETEKAAGLLITDLEELKDSLRVAYDYIQMQSGNVTMVKTQLKTLCDENVHSQMETAFASVVKKIDNLIKTNKTIREYLCQARIHRVMCLKRQPQNAQRDLQEAIDLMEKAMLNVAVLNKVVKQFRIIKRQGRASGKLPDENIQNAVFDCVSTLQAMISLLIDVQNAVDEFNNESMKRSDVEKGTECKDRDDQSFLECITAAPVETEHLPTEISRKDPEAEVSVSENQQCLPVQDDHDINKDGESKVVNNTEAEKIGVMLSGHGDESLNKTTPTEEQPETCSHDNNDPSSNNEERHMVSSDVSNHYT